MGDVCVIFNPAAGKKQAGRRLEKLRRAWNGRVDFFPTSSSGHALELARQAALDGYRIVTAAGGDGTVHEVANGILLAQRPEVQFAILPIGSANDYAYSLGVDQSSSTEIRRVDVGLIRDPGGKEKYFVCCLGLGFNGAVTLESRKIHKLQGIALYGLATLRALWYHYHCPVMEVAFDGQSFNQQTILMLSVLLGCREGGFVMAPAARLDDGWFDYVVTGNLSRWEVLGLLPRLALFGPPSHHPKLEQGRCRKVRLRSPVALTIHVDGEFFAKPEDDIREVEIQILPGALLVHSGCPVDV